jgi:hypothetical protein
VTDLAETIVQKVRAKGFKTSKLSEQEAREYQSIQYPAAQWGADVLGGPLNRSQANMITYSQDAQAQATKIQGLVDSATDGRASVLLDHRQFNQKYGRDLPGWTLRKQPEQANLIEVYLTAEPDR